PATATAGTAFSTTVTARDAFANTVTGYAGTIHFTSTDGGAALELPGDYTFVGGDKGAHVFTSAVTLVTAGTQTVTATDTVTNALTGTSGNVGVSAASLAHFTVSAPA